MKNKLIITGSLYSKLKKETTTIEIKEIAERIDNLFFQALISSLQSFSSKSPTGKLIDNNSR